MWSVVVLPCGLDQHRAVDEILVVPGEPRLHQLQPLAVLGDLQFDRAAIRRRRDVGRVAGVETMRRHLGCGLWRVEPEWPALNVGQRVGHRVERQPPGERHRGHDLGAADKVHRRRLAVVAAREIAVVGGDDRVRHRTFGGRAPPLADARAAGIGEHRPVDVLQRLHLAVALDRRAHRLRSRRHQKRRGRLDPVRLRLLGDIGRTAHILVGGIGAAADQCRRDPVDKPVLCIRDLGGEPGNRPRPVRRMRPDDVGFEP